MNSMLNQMVMAHRTNHWWIEEFESKIADYDPLLDYRAILSNWAQSFGENELLPLIYNKQEDIAVRFGSAVGIAVKPSDGPVPNPNPALDATSYRVLRELKRDVSDEDLSALVQRAHEEMSRCFIDTFRDEGIRLVDDRICAAINANYSESNEWVRKRWFPERTTLFDPE